MQIKFDKLRASYLNLITLSIVATLLLQQATAVSNCNGGNKLYDTAPGSTVCTQKGRDITNCLYYDPFYTSTGIIYLGCKTCTNSAVAVTPTVGLQVPLNTTKGSTIDVYGACQPTSQQVLNCGLYKMHTNGSYYCTKCSGKSQWVLLTNGKQGCSTTKISNCDSYDTATLICSKCSSGYSLQTFSNDSLGCTSNSISNCATYDATTLICSKCSSDYSLQTLSNGSLGCTSKSISNCEAYDATTLICSTCSSGYSLQKLSNGSLGCTSASISHCDTYDATTLICSTCSSGYSLQTLSNGSLGCTSSSISNCATYNTATLICSECSSDYSLQTLSNGSLGCTSTSIDNCDTYDATTLICSTCSLGYSLQKLSNGSLGCTSISISNCDTYDAETLICSKCSSGYSLQTLSNGSLGCTSTSISNCDTYNAATLICSTCSSGYSLQKLSNGSLGCTSNSISNCDTYDPINLYCSKCSSGYSLQTLTNGSLGCTSTSISNCATYDKTTLICSTCNSQFQLEKLTNSSLSCVPKTQLIQFCDIYSYSEPNFACDTCLSNYLLTTDAQSNQICQIIPIPGCSHIETIIVNGQSKNYCDTCFNYQGCIQFCLAYTDTITGKITCKTCISNYKPTVNQLGNRICVPNSIIVPFNCLQIDSQGQNGKISSNNVKCLSCSQNNVLNYQTNICVTQVLMCSTYKGNLCAQCVSPYQLLTTVQVQECVMPIPTNCKNYNKTSGNCMQCQTGYFLNSGKTCDLYKVCPSYQYLNIDTNVCINGQIQNCLTYLNANQCSYCQTNYKLDSLGFSCTYAPPPVICPSNTNSQKYQNILGVCVKININCQYYLDNGYCYQCVSEYYAYDGSCFIKQSSQNLQTSMQTNIICANDQYLIGINCIKIPSNCALFDKSSQLCESCSKGYELVIINNINNCVQNIVCPKGTYQFNWLCLPVDQNCITFNYDTNNCDLCITGFQSSGSFCVSKTNISNCSNNPRLWYNGVRCIEISQTCETFNRTTGQCWTCFSPYVLIFPGTCGLNQTTFIISCPKNTVQIANQICIPQIPNCKTYQLILGYCLTCAKGYQIDTVLHTCHSIS